MSPQVHRRPLSAASLALVAVAFGSGCQLFSPSHLWKLNRHPPLGQDDAYFSIPNGPATVAATNPSQIPEKTDVGDVMTVAPF